MARTIEVEIDASGIIHPVNPSDRLPEGRAMLIWPSLEEASGLILSEKSLAVDWLKPEEDEAWAYLQPGK
jgi:hypothetical protein